MLTSTKSWYSSSPGEPDGPSGLFLRRLQRHRRSCSNPPSRVRLRMPGKTKNQRNFYAGPFGGRGWMSRAALLKTAHWAVFALSSATAPQLFESTLAVLCRNSNKTETPASSQRWSSWWSEATQIRTIALWGIFGGDFIESDGFCAVFVVECNQNFFIIEINSIHECIDKRFPVAFHVRVELAEPGQPETNLIFA